MTNRPDDTIENERIRADIKDALAALRESVSNQKSINDKLDSVSRKQDGIPEMLAALERRQREELMMLKHEMENMFVAKQEYNPKHQALEDRMKAYDKIIEGAAVRQEEFTTMKTIIKQHDKDIEELVSRPGNMTNRVVMLIAIAISILGFALNFLQHIQIR